MATPRILLENILSLTLLQAINYIAPLITLPYLVRVLQPSQFGLLSFAQSIVIYFDFFIDFGFNLSATRAIAASGRNDGKAMARIFWSTIFAKLLFLCISATALAILVECVPKLRASRMLFAVTSLYLIGTTLFPTWLFQGVEKMKLAVGALGIARLLAAGSLILAVKHPADYVLAGAIQASVELVASFLAVPLIFRWVKVSWHRPSISDLVACIADAWPVFLSSSSLFLSLSSTTAILGLMAGQTEVGYYSAADKLIKACVAILNPLNQALYPHIVLRRFRSPVSALQMIRKCFAVLVGLSIPISIGTAIAARPFCRFFFGSSFDRSAMVLQCLSPLPFLFALISVLGTQTMLVFNMEAELAKVTLAGGIISIPAAMLLCYTWGAVGAAVSSVFMATIVAGGMFWVLQAKGLHVWKSSDASSLPLGPITQLGME